MELLKGDAGPVFIVLYLLPGVLGVVVYDYLISGERKGVIEQIFLVLALDVVSSLLVHVVFRVPLGVFAEVTEDASVTEFIELIVRNNLLYLSIASVLISAGFAFANKDNLLYNILRNIGVVNRIGSVDVWQEVFRRSRRMWVRVTFSDGRILVGWPSIYSLSGRPRELFLSDATWWNPKGNGEYAQVEVIGAGVYLSDFSKVTAIELLK